MHKNNLVLRRDPENEAGMKVQRPLVLRSDLKFYGSTSITFLECTKLKYYAVERGGGRGGGGGGGERKIVPHLGYEGIEVYAASRDVLVRNRVYILTI